MQVALRDNDAHSLASRLGLGPETKPHMSTTSHKPEAQAEGMRAALRDNVALRLSGVLGQRHPEAVVGQFHACRKCGCDGGMINLVRHVHEDRSPCPHLSSNRHRLVNRKVGRVS